MLAAVVIACAVPFFAQVSENAGLRDVLTATPEDSQLLLFTNPPAISTADIANIQGVWSGAMQSQLGSYLRPDSEFTLQAGGLALETANQALQNSTMQLTGVSISQARPHLRLLQGRLPAVTGANVEVALTTDTAAALRVTAGSTITVGVELTIRGGTLLLGQFIQLTEAVPLRVVGLIAPPDDEAYWHGDDFQPEEGASPIFQAIMSTPVFVTMLTNLAQQHGGAEVVLADPATILWVFSLDVAHLTLDQLDDLIARLNAMPVQFGEQANAANLPTPTLVSSTLLENDNFPSSLERFRDRIGLVQIPVATLTAQIVALLLFFVSLIASLLIEGQWETIALLRSRGARRRQVFGAFATQSLALGLVALLAGPFLAILLVRLLGQFALAPGEQSVLATTLGEPLQAVLRVGWFAVAAVGGAVLATLVAIGGAARRDVLALRREAARSMRRPLWQRLALDVVAAIIALTGFGVSLYLVHSGTLDARTLQLLATPLALIGPVFLLIAGALVFLRLFPLLLRLFARLAARRPGAPALLALAQVARAPQTALRLILLLSLSLAFANFTLVFNASENQRLAQVAAQQVSADFSGTLSLAPANVKPVPTPRTWARRYQAVPGVLAASAGYFAHASLADGSSTLDIEVQAVDPNTFARTVIWTPQDSSQPLSAVLAQLEHAVYPGLPVAPAIVDAVAWTQLHLSPGTIFTLSLPNIPQGIFFQAVAEVQHIPGVNDSLATGGVEGYSPPGGLITDFDILSLTQDTLGEVAGNMPPPLTPNQLWLRTSDAPTALAHVRAALSSGPLRLTAFRDRRALIAQMQQDPLDRTLTGVLWLGTLTTLLLALVGALLSSWVSARRRLTNFALLRALGSTPRQIASALTWEQGIVYAVALLLGGLFGALLVWIAVPGLVFANPDTPDHPISSGAFYVIQQVLPPQITLPATLGIALAVLVAICAAALMLMARAVSTPSISQTLRLNED